MSLPDVAWQVLYGRIAWAVLVAAAVVGVWAWREVPSRRTIVMVLLASAGLMAIPHEGSPAHWLGLAFQWPSTLCVALAALTLGAHWQGPPTAAAMPPRVAAALAVAGALLYLDASGWLSLGLYFAGFGPNAAPMVALVMALACVVGIARRVWRWRAAAFLSALTLYMVFRLPTGNLWDALLDPFLWGWSVASLVTTWRRRRALSRPDPRPSPALEP